MTDLEDIAECTSSPLLYLQNELLQVKGDDAAFAASHFGVCKGILSLLRESVGTQFDQVFLFSFLPRYLSNPVNISEFIICVKQPGFMFPSDVMLKHGLLNYESSLINPNELTALQDTVHDIASQAYAHMERGR